jgi:hypothetical protein
VLIPVLFLSHRIKGLSFSSSYHVLLIVSRSRPQGVRWNACKAVRNIVRLILVVVDSLVAFACTGCAFAMIRDFLTWLREPIAL